MRDGKRGDDLQHIPKCWLEAPDRLPDILSEHHHRWQQQREQKQDVIEADPDVPYALAGIIKKLCEAARPGQLKGLLCSIGTENRRTRPALKLQAQQPFVLGIKVKKQLITDGEAGAGLLAGCLEAQHRVSAIAMTVNEVFSHPRLARLAIQGYRQARKCIRIDVRMTRTHLAPGDFTIAVAIQTDREVQIAQGDIPLTAHGVTSDRDAEITVARFMRQHG